MRKPSAPRPERSDRAQDAPASIPPRRSGPRRPRPTRSAQGPSAPSAPTDQGTEQTGPSATARRPRTASASRTSRGAGGALPPSRPRRSTMSRGASSASPSSRRRGEGTSRTSPRQASPSPDAAASTELTVFGRRQVALSGGDDRVVSTGLADRLKERQAALHRLRQRRVVTTAVVALEVGRDRIDLVLGRVAGEQCADTGGCGCVVCLRIVAAKAAREERGRCAEKSADHEDGERTAHRIKHENPPLGPEAGLP